MDATTINTIATVAGIVFTVSGIIVTVILTRKKKIITISERVKLYVSPYSNGSFVFDYSNNDGQYEIGQGQHSFCTKWSKASHKSIHAYMDGKGIDSISLLKAPVDLANISSIEGDFSSRSRTPQIGDAVIWKNSNGKYAITKIDAICDDTRGDKNDKLECEYVILE